MAEVGSLWGPMKGAARRAGESRTLWIHAFGALGTATLSRLWGAQGTLESALISTRCAMERETTA